MGSHVDSSDEADKWNIGRTYCFLPTCVSSLTDMTLQVTRCRDIGALRFMQPCTLQTEARTFGIVDRTNQRLITCEGEASMLDHKSVRDKIKGRKDALP